MITHLQAKQLVDASRALASAFHEDPLQKYVFPADADRQARSPAHFLPLLRYGLMFGEVYTTEDPCLGVSVCLPPGHTDVTEENSVAAGLDCLPALIGEQPAERFMSVLAHLEPFHSVDVPEPHWYVMVVGVAPEGRDQGLGRRLLEPMLARARECGHPCYLETAQPSNVGFYEHLGFRVLRHAVEPTSGLPLWTFRWNAT